MTRRTNSNMYYRVHDLEPVFILWSQLLLNGAGLYSMEPALMVLSWSLSYGAGLYIVWSWTLLYGADLYCMEPAFMNGAGL